MRFKKDVLAKKNLVWINIFILWYALMNYLYYRYYSVIACALGGLKKIEISSVLFPILHHIDRYHVKFEGPRWLGSASSGPDKMALTPLWVKKKMFGLWGSWYSNRPARTHGFNAKIGFEKYATSPEISAKKCQILLVWFGRPILDTFWPISRDSLHIFQNRFLRWNRESEPVDLNTMNPEPYNPKKKFHS